jgi:dTDP-glucose 4,6-dehydratase
MRLLVCGGAGFIGSNFIRHMIKKYPSYAIVNYDKLTYAGNLDNLRDIELFPNYKFIKGDICDLERVNEVIQKNQITHIINFAAETHVDRSIHGGAKEFVLTNSLGVQMLLDAARINGVMKMVNVSTDEVYGALGLTEKRKFTEKTSIWPNMPYAAAKAGGDLMCQAYWATHKVPVIVTHCSNNYGPYQYPEKLIPYFIFKAMAGEKLPVYGDGLYVRDWIYVTDHAKALDLLLHKGVPGEVYNIGSDNERPNIEITKMILKFLNRTEEQIEYVKDRPGHDRRYAIDATKIYKLGWRPDYPQEKFEQGLRETIDWYLKNVEWVKNLKEKAELANPHIETKVKKVYHRKVNGKSKKAK